MFNRNFLTANLLARDLDISPELRLMKRNKNFLADISLMCIACLSVIERNGTPTAVSNL